MEIAGQIQTPDEIKEIKVARPMLITELVNSAGLFLNTSCAGKGTCGGCAVDLLAGTYQLNDETFVIASGQKRRVLGCQTRILEGPFKISIPRRSLVETGEKVVADFVISEHRQLNPTIQQLTVELSEPELGKTSSDYEQLITILREKHNIKVSDITPSALKTLPVALRSNDYKIKITLAWLNGDWRIIAVDPPCDDEVSCNGLAVDIGTTTVVASLVDMSSGRIVDTVSRYNQQIQQADDIAARIAHASEQSGLNQLQKLIIKETINPLTRLLCEKHQVGCNNIKRMVISGNTVMWHIFLGLDPSAIGVVPFQPVARKVSPFSAKELGLSIFPDAPIDVVPSISAYIGGDIVSDLEICRAHYHNGLSLLIDIGTNGEMAISDGQKMFVTACAAGPAFEGLRISNGMRASAGAIERIKLSNNGCDCEYKVIGSGKPVGICGSALIDFLAEALREGVINSAGRIQKDKAQLCLRIRCGENNICEYVIAYSEETEDRTGDITINEKDIETILQAKAAIFSAVYILTSRLGREVGFNAFDRIFLAGGFARYINIENAIAIGLLPDVDIDRYEVIGNGSLAGAFLGLIDKNVWREFERIMDLPEVIELNLDPDFQDEYTLALFLPHMRAVEQQM